MPDPIHFFPTPLLGMVSSKQAVVLRCIATLVHVARVQPRTACGTITSRALYTAGEPLLLNLQFLTRDGSHSMQHCYMPPYIVM